jgi:hypothetical protein
MLVKSRLLYTGGVGGMELKDEVEIKFVSEDFPGISLFRRRDKREQSEKLDELVVAWVCATQKVPKGCKSVNEPKRVVLHWWQDVVPVVTPETPVNLKDITVEDAEHDELVPYWNGMDIYQMMPLFIGGRDAWLQWKDRSQRTKALIIFAM